MFMENTEVLRKAALLMSLLLASYHNWPKNALKYYYKSTFSSGLVE